MIYLLAIASIFLFILYVLYVRSGVRLYQSNVSMEGKLVIVTGANAGLGYHTALDLAKRGARVILACRDEGRGTTAQDTIRAETGNNDVFFKKLDLSSLDSVREFAANIINTEKELHVLINNAGLYGYSETLTEDGIVATIQINYLGHFLLTLLLLPLLKRAKSSRIINLSSNLHFFGTFNRTKINIPGYYHNFFAYSNSKLCMLLFAIELSRRLKGTTVVANAVHPGVIHTNITSNIPFFLRHLFILWCRLYSRTPEQGAQTVIYLAVDKECENVSGKYFVDYSNRITSWKTFNKKLANDLWEYSEKLVGYSDKVIISVN